MPYAENQQIEYHSKIGLPNYASHGRKEIIESQILTGQWGEILPYRLNDINIQQEKYWHLVKVFLNKLSSVDFNNFNLINSESLLNTGLISIGSFINQGLNDVYFEFTFEKSILFISNYVDYKIYLELFFNEESEQLNQIEDSVLNVYKNQENVLCEAGETFEVFNRLEAFISNIKRNNDGYRFDYEYTFVPTIFNSSTSLQHY